MQAIVHTDHGFMVRVYPGSDIVVEMQPEAVVHLFRLVQRYNWCWEDPGRFSDRWRKFWPKIAQVERSIVVRFVTANQNGHFRDPLYIEELPAVLTPFAGVSTPAKLTQSVEDEFGKLLHIFDTSCKNWKYLRISELNEKTRN